MRIKSLIFIFFIMALPLSSQIINGESQNNSDFYSIRHSYLQLLEKNKANLPMRNGFVEGEKIFRRWENYMEPRVYPSGKFPAPGILLEEFEKFRQNNEIKTDTLFKADWKPIESPEGFPNYGYAGRLNCIAFHPLDSNIMFVGSPSGGLWKTVDGGITWIPKTDYFPSLGVSEIVINPKNPKIMYLATGDRDAANFISNPYSYGILKSTDGGETWANTGLNHIFAEQMTIQRLIINPENPNILLAAVTGVNGTARGIWRTTDEGSTWKLVSGGGKYDVEFHPANPDICYASAWKNIIRSSDGGISWTVISNPNLPVADNFTWSRIAVTPANPELVFVQYLAPNGMTYGVYKSSDAGLNWEKQNSVSISTQSSYDWVFSCSPVDSNVIFWAGVEFYVSMDGGKNYYIQSSGHVDHHAIEFSPLTKALFNCNDGGLYKSYYNGSGWINMNKSFQTFQFYRLGCAPQNEKLILTGAQDNGSMRHSGGSWKQFFGADGMECLFDYTDTTIYYSAYQYGGLSRIGKGLGTFRMPPGGGQSTSCAWVTPYLIHPKKPEILYFGGKDIYKTTTRGNEWTNYSIGLTAADGVGGGFLRTMAISESNPDSVLYAASYVVVYKTSDGGVSWKNITTNLPVSAGCFDCSAITYLAVHPENQDIAWICMSGYSKSNRVFKTVDGGTSWQNISLNLPSVPVNCIVFEKESNEALYIGTDIGVFFKDSTMNEWIPFMTGLPNVPVSELEIHYGSKRIRAATFGRGLWESNLFGEITSVGLELTNREIPLLYPNPTDGIINLPDEYQLGSEIIVYSSLGNIVSRFVPESRFFDAGSLDQGVYFIRTANFIYKFIRK